jgi:signal transduction histidine kinase
MSDAVATHMALDASVRLPVRRGRLMVSTVIVAGTLIAGIWLSAWHYFSGEVARLEAEIQATSARYFQAQEELSATRADVYRASILIRDLLLSTKPPLAATRQEPLAAYDSAIARLEHYEPVQSGDDRVRTEQLRQEILALRQATAGLIATDNDRWAVAARTWQLSDLRPRRQAAIAIANELQALNRDAFRQHQRRLMALYREYQGLLSTSVTVAVIASLGIALFAAFRVTGLERHLFRQHERDVRNQQDLKRLSAALITAQEEERRSIARELHDEVGQVLTAIKVELSVVERELTSRGQRVDGLEGARSITDRALQTVRDLSRLLHPAMLDDIGLCAALDWYIRGYSKRHGIIVDYEASGIIRRLAPSIETNVYRIVQEALTNIVRHAGATACTVRVEEAGAELRVIIADEGQGFDCSARPAADAGLGLIGIRERAALLGGHVKIDSTPGQGTRIELTVPLQWREEPDEEYPASLVDQPRSSAGQIVLGGGL